MKQSKLNHWFIDGNKISINLMRFCIEINPCVSNYVLCFVLIIKINQDNMFLRFETLEECIDFTEIINEKCENMNDIMEEYKSLYSKKLSKKIKNN